MYYEIVVHIITKIKLNFNNEFIEASIIKWYNYYGGSTMKKMNVIVVFDNKIENTLMCKRTKEPYMGMYNLVGGKIEKENDGENEA